MSAKYDAMLINCVMWYLVNHKYRIVKELFDDAAEYYRQEWMDRDPAQFWLHLDSANQVRLLKMVKTHYTAQLATVQKEAE